MSVLQLNGEKGKTNYFLLKTKLKFLVPLSILVCTISFVNTSFSIPMPVCTLSNIKTIFSVITHVCATSVAYIIFCVITNICTI